MGVAGAASREAEERRQERDGDHHRHGDDDGRREPQRRHERDTGELETENGDDHRASGEDDRLAGGGVGVARRLFHVHARGEVVAVTTEDEQGVVDTDTETDHGPEARSHRRDLDPGGEKTDHGQADGQARQRRHEREGHGDQRPERDVEDDQRGHDADRLRRPGRSLLQERGQFTTELHLSARLFGRRCVGDELVEDVPSELRSRGVELNGRERRGTVGRDRRASRDRVGDSESRRHRLDPSNRCFDPGGDPGVGHRTVRDVEHDHRSGAGALGELLVQHVEGLLRFDARYLEVVDLAGIDDAVDHPRADDRDEPHDDHEPAVPEGERSGPVQPA